MLSNGHVGQYAVHMTAAICGAGCSTHDSGDLRSGMLHTGKQKFVEQYAS